MWLALGRYQFVMPNIAVSQRLTFQASHAIRH